MADIETYQNFVDTKCNICNLHVGIGIQCSLCHKWTHLSSEKSSFGGGTAHHGNAGAEEHRSGQQQQLSLSTSNSLSHIASGGGQSLASGGGMMSAHQHSNNNAASATTVPPPASLGGASSFRGNESVSTYLMGAPSMALTNAASMIYGQAAIGSTAGSSSPTGQHSGAADHNNHNNHGTGSGVGTKSISISCPGIPFPRYLPYFCSDCKLCCASADMNRITEIFDGFLTEENDDVQGGAPIIFNSITASFVRKRVRAIGTGPEVLSEKFSAEKLFGVHGAHAALARQQSIVYDINDEDSRRMPLPHLPPQIDYFDDGRFLRTQLKWESMFPRQTLTVLRQILAYIYPARYDDSMVIAAAKAAKARHRGKQVAANNMSVAAAVALSAILKAQQAQPNVSALSQHRQQRQLQEQNKFFAPISFIAPTLACDDDDDLDPLTSAGAGSRKGAGNTSSSSKRVWTKEQDMQMMEMQHEVTLSRLQWTPQDVGVSVHEREVFGPQPVYVNPITAQIRLSEVVVEVGPDGHSTVAH